MNGTSAQAKRDDWKTIPMSERHTSLSVDRHYAPDEMKSIQQGVIPDSMDDKWFIFFEDDVLYCHRSWTGCCIYQAEFERVGDHFQVSRLLVTRDPEEYKITDDAYDIRLFAFLVDRLLLGKSVRFPESRGKDTDKEKRALKLWSIFGSGIFKKPGGSGKRG